MVELLNEVDTTGVAVTTTMADRKNVLRADIAQKVRAVRSSLKCA